MITKCVYHKSWCPICHETLPQSPTSLLQHINLVELHIHCNYTLYLYVQMYTRLQNNAIPATKNAKILELSIFYIKLWVLQSSKLEDKWLKSDSRRNYRVMLAGAEKRYEFNRNRSDFRSLGGDTKRGVPLATKQKKWGLSHADKLEARSKHKNNLSFDTKQTFRLAKTNDDGNFALGEKYMERDICAS